MMSNMELAQEIYIRIVSDSGRVCNLEDIKTKDIAEFALVAAKEWAVIERVQNVTDQGEFKLGKQK